jgi:hypothetical protein
MARGDADGAKIYWRMEISDVIVVGKEVGRKGPRVRKRAGVVEMTARARNRYWEWLLF